MCVVLHARLESARGCKAPCVVSVSIQLQGVVLCVVCCVFALAHKLISPHITPHLGKGKENAAPKKDATNKRKSSGGSSSSKSASSKRSSGGSSNGGKKKKKKIATVGNEEGARMILEYMTAQNRPYSHTQVFDNLHGRVKKASVPKLLEQLANEGKLTLKCFKKTKLYLVNQDQFPAVSADELKDLDVQVR